MSDRAAQISAFLARSGHADWAQHPIAADASNRRYLRLKQGAQSCILMDAPPTTGEDLAPFVTMAAWLRAAGLTAPEPLAINDGAGLLLLTDLGRIDLAGALDAAPDQALALYQASTDVLVHLAQIAPPRDLPRLTPALAGEMVAITGTHYAGCALPALSAAMTAAMAAHAPRADHLALRDYHAENLIWRADRTGLDRIGLLDFQDAFVAPLGYDLASLLRDVRRDVPAQICTAMTAHFAAATGAGADFSAQLACLGAQRNLRILGVFARLAQVAGKTRYLAMLPRVWDQLQTDLRHPALADLRAVVDAALPPPSAAHLARLIS